MPNTVAVAIDVPATVPLIVPLPTPNWPSVSHGAVNVALAVPRLMRQEASPAGYGQTGSPPASSARSAASRPATNARGPASSSAQAPVPVGSASGVNSASIRSISARMVGASHTVSSRSRSAARYIARVAGASYRRQAIEPQANTESGRVVRSRPVNRASMPHGMNWNFPVVGS